MTRKIKLFLVDDQLLFRQSLRSLIKEFAQLDLLAEAENGIEALELLNKHDPDVILLDIKMPLMNGKETTIEIKKKFPGIKVIILSMYDDAYYTLDLFKSGADSYLPKNCDIDELVFAIETVYKGERYLDKRSQNILEIEGEIKKPENAILDQLALNEIEKKILLLVAIGKSGKEIIAELNIPIATFNHNKKIIRFKTSCKNDAQLALYAVNHGFVSKSSDI
jgi:DNA-binding NarL/FixJ family response regulator